MRFTCSAVIAREGGRSSTPRPIGSITNLWNTGVTRSSLVKPATTEGECVARSIWRASRATEYFLRLPRWLRQARKNAGTSKKRNASGERVDHQGQGLHCRDL